MTFVRHFLTTIKNMTAAQPTEPEDPPMFTQVEFDTLERVINETQVSSLFCNICKRPKAYIVKVLFREIK